MPTELMAKCALSSKSNETVKNALLLASTSKVFQEIINSEEFFKVLIHQVRDDYCLSAKLSSFKERYFELRRCCSSKIEDFPGVFFGDAIISDGEIELFEFLNGIDHFKLHSDNHKIVIPENMKPFPSLIGNKMPHVVRSEKYLAISKMGDFSVYVFTPDGSQCLTRLDVPKEICQLDIKYNKLLVVIGQGGGDQLMAFDLDQAEEQVPLSIPLKNLNYLPVCFGNEYVICVQWDPLCDQACVLKLSSIEEKLFYCSGSIGKRILQYFPYENDFLEVSYKSRESEISLSKFSIKENGVTLNLIANDITRDIPDFFKQATPKLHFHNERLFLAYDVQERGTTIFAYDLVSKKMSKVLAIPALDNPLNSFKPRFLSVSETIYYIRMKIEGWEEDDGVKTHLTSIKYCNL